VTLLQKTIAHLRVYESSQILAPGVFGILSQQSLPPLHILVLYAICYWSHALSVYAYNDYCDYAADSLNPRKTNASSKSRLWLRNLTIGLTLVFIASIAFMPPGVIGLLVLSQVVCMAYSDPRTRWKGVVLGSEVAHFVAGYCYFISGALVAGGDASPHMLGGLIFGLLYVTGGTFNEIMDADADREADLRHLVVVVGKRRVLGGLLAVHYLCFALLALYEPSWVMMIGCGAAALLYAVLTRGLIAHVDDLDALLAFRQRYRIIFAALVVMLCASRAAALAS
jgi:4-hydroxybenzoate polyprenyltransferase